MSFFKRNASIIVFVGGLLMLLGRIGMALKYSSRLKMKRADANDKLISHEIDKLNELWRNADVEDLVTYEKMTNPSQLAQARVRLKQIEIGIQESEERVKGVTGKTREFFQKAHAYYRLAASAILDFVDFLIAKKGKYSIKEKENQISFDSESDEARYQELINQLSYVYQEAEILDTCISNHYCSVEKKL